MDDEEKLEPVTPPNPPTSWTVVTTGTDNGISGIAYGKDKFVAVGGSSTVAWGATSADGVTWDPIDLTAVFDRNPTRVVFINNVFIAAKGSGSDDYVGISTDGTTWAKIPNAQISFGMKGLGYGNGIYVGGGQGGKMAYSANAEGWTTLANTATTFTGNGSAAYINAIVYGNGKFVAGGGKGHVAYSTDGETWTSLDLVDDTGFSQTEIIFDQGFINSAVFANGKFVAVGGKDAGPGKAAYSSDGITWTESGAIGVGEDTMINGIAYGNGYFVLVDNKGYGSYSSDGITWIKIADTGLEGTAINGVTYGNGKFVIVGAGGKAAYSVVE
jgi:hypothetical protein